METDMTRMTPNLISFNVECLKGKIYGLETRSGAQSWFKSYSSLATFGLS